MTVGTPPQHLAEAGLDRPEGRGIRPATDCCGSTPAGSPSPDNADAHNAKDDERASRANGRHVRVSIASDNMALQPWRDACGRVRANSRAS